MARPSSRVIMKVFVIALCVFGALARPEDTKVKNKRSVAKSETGQAPLPATPVKQVNHRYIGNWEYEHLDKIDSLLNDALNNMSFPRSQPHKCSNGEGLCDPNGQQIKNLNISSETIKYSTDWTAENKTIRNKRMDKQYNLACYYFMPNDYSEENLYPDEINPALCTHIIVTGAEVQNNSVYFHTALDKNLLKQVVGLRKKNPKLKVLLSIVNFSNGSHSNKGLSGVVANKDNLEQFVFNVVSVVSEYYLDGIDINWQFPSWPLLNLEERYGFAKLLETLHYHLPDSLLTAAVAAPITMIKKAYLMFSLANFVDFINVMAFDYHEYHQVFSLTGANSPLFSSRYDTGYLQDLNINSSIQYWISQGMPKEKILLGMPTFGRSYKLKNENNHGFNAPTSGPGIGERGYVSFPEVCEFKSNENATTVFDLDTLTPYTYHKEDWISFDNENSLSFKAEYATSLGLGGAMVYFLNTDDYIGSSQCTSKEFPLTSMIKSVLNNNF